MRYLCLEVSKHGDNKIMSKKLKRFKVVMLVLSMATLIVLGSTEIPAYAQENAGSAIIAEVVPLSSVGEGDARVLTSNWQSLAPNDRHVYRFDYDGGDQPIRVWMNALPANGAQFQIWTEELLLSLDQDPQLAPFGVGEPISTGSEFSIWQGNAPAAAAYYVVVTSTADIATQYLLNISSPGLSDEQPGTIAPTPIPPTATPVPPATPIPPVTPVTPGPTPTGTPQAAVVAIVPAATPDPNVAVVTVAALNVRSGPSTAYPVITTVPSGTILEVLGRNEANTWIFVRLPDDTEGWVTRTLTDYLAIAVIVITPEAPPTPTPIPGITATPTPNTAIIIVEAPVPQSLDENWHLLREGETDWYKFQYRGGGLPVHVWMDVEPGNGAIFNILNEETALSILAGVAPTVVNAIGRGTVNPVEPGYVFWRADFPEADTLYVMVQHEGATDTIYSINAGGPGLGRTLVVD